MKKGREWVIKEKFETDEVDLAITKLIHQVDRMTCYC